MEPEGTLPCSQEPTAGPYPEPDEKNPNFPRYFPKIHLVVSSHLLASLPSGLFTSGFTTKILYAFLIFHIRATFFAPHHKYVRILRTWHRDYSILYNIP
jgi:hypothetical protein